MVEKKASRGGVLDKVVLLLCPGKKKDMVATIYDYQLKVNSKYSLFSIYNEHFI